MKLSIIIPVYNEVRTFIPLMERVLALKIPKIDKEIVIVESNSTDGTRDLVKKFEKKKNIKVIYEKRPRGKGHALKKAFHHVTGDIVLIQDADLEYKPEEYPELIDPIIKGKTKFVLGSRHLGMKDWKIRKFVRNKLYEKVLNLGDFLYTSLFNFLYGVRLTDPATMFKVFKRECIKNMRFRSNYFELDWEIVAKLIRAGYLPKEVPVSYASRTTAQGKKIRFFRDGTLVLFAILYFRFFD